MCSLVVMCAIVLLWTGAEGAVISGDTTVYSDNRNIGEQCFSKCVPRCVQLVNSRNIRCCDCLSLCEATCDRSLKPRSNEVSGVTPGASCTHGVCDLPAALWRRLLASPRRRSRSPMLREAAIIARSVGMDLGPVDLGSEEDVSDSSLDLQVVARLGSLVRGDDAVTASVYWDSFAAPGRPSGTRWYLVTWEPEGGGVRGSLLTNTTSASLTLEADVVYHIQVSPTSSKGSSNCLEVDTHSPFPTSTPHLLTRGTIRVFSLRVEVLGGGAAAVSMFLVILLHCTKIWRNRLETSSKTSKHSHQDFNHFKLYPPPVTLAHLERPNQLTV